MGGQGGRDHCQRWIFRIACSAQRITGTRTLVHSYEAGTLQEALGGKAPARGVNEQLRTPWGMNFDSLATLQWGVPTVSEQGRLRRLVRKVLELPPAERQKCCITVGD